MSKGYWNGNVTILGNSRVVPEFFYRELIAFGCDKINQDDTEGLRRAVQQTLHSLEASGLFEKVEAELAPEDSAALENSIKRRISGKHHKAGGRYDADLRIHVKEKGIPFLEMGTYARSRGSQSSSPLQEVEFKVDAALRSPLGYGEWGQVTLATSRLGTRDLSLNFRLPHIGKALSVLNLKAMINEEDKSYYQSYKLSSKIVSAELASRSGLHQWEWSWVSRDEIPRKFHQDSSSSDKKQDLDDKYEGTSRDVTRGILNALSASTKMALKYTGTLLDTRDSASDPSEGSFMQGCVELSLPPGTAQFLKGDAKVQVHRQIGPSILGQTGLVASLAGNLGVVMPLAALTPLLTPASKRENHIPEFVPNLSIPLADRYTLGGPLSLRGFDMYGVGARSFRGREHHLQKHGLNPYGKPDGFTAPIGDSLGGVGIASALALLSFPLPFRNVADKLAGVRAFTFVNAGSLASPTYWAHYYCRAIGIGTNYDNSMSFWAAPRAAVGGGVSVAFSPSARLELTYSIPLLKSDHDSTRGFQIGLGLSVN